MRRSRRPGTHQRLAPANARTRASVSKPEDRGGECRPPDNLPRAFAFGHAETFQTASTMPQQRVTELGRCLVGTEIVLMSWIALGPHGREDDLGRNDAMGQLRAARQVRPPTDGPGVPS